MKSVAGQVEIRQGGGGVMSMRDVAAQLPPYDEFEIRTGGEADQRTPDTETQRRRDSRDSETQAAAVLRFTPAEAARGKPQNAKEEYRRVAVEVMEEYVQGRLRIEREDPVEPLPEVDQLSFTLCQWLRGVPGADDHFAADHEIFRDAVVAYWRGLLAAGVCEDVPTTFDGKPTNEESHVADWLDDRFACFEAVWPTVRQPGGGLLAAYRRAQAAPVTLVGLPRRGRRYTLFVSILHHLQLAAGEDADIWAPVHGIARLLGCHHSVVADFVKLAVRDGFLVSTNGHYSREKRQAKAWRFKAPGAAAPLAVVAEAPPALPPVKAVLSHFDKLYQPRHQGERADFTKKEVGLVADLLKRHSEENICRFLDAFFRLKAEEDELLRQNGYTLALFKTRLPAILGKLQRQEARSETAIEKLRRQGQLR